MQTICFIGAMRDETDPLVREFNTKPNENGHEEAVVGEMRVLVICCGVGKVNAAATTQKIIMTYHPDYVVNVGIAGSLTRRFPLCTVVLCSRCQYHDMEPGDLLTRYPPYMVEFPAGEKLLRVAREAADVCPSVHTVAVAKCVSGERVVSETEESRQLAERFKAVCVDMESAAIAHVCLLEKVEFLAIRCTSDFTDEAALPLMDRQVYRVAMQLSEISRYLAENL